jgi:short-subunit dehydrogenase
MIQTNLVAPILVTKTFLPHLRRTRGTLVVVSSIGGKLAAPTRALYSATKFGVNGFFHSLRLELRRHGVAVCIAMPASVETDLQRSALDAPGSAVLGAPAARPMAKPLSTGLFARMSPATCATAIREGADRRAPWIYIPGWYWAVAWLQYLLPGTIDAWACKKYKM